MESLLRWEMTMGQVGRRVEIEIEQADNSSRPTGIGAADISNTEARKGVGRW